METQKELQEIITEQNINRITKIEQIDEIYDYELMMQTNDLDVREDKIDEINVILFDTQVYNSCYLLDVFKDYIDECGELMEHVKIHYCDDLGIYKTLFTKFWVMSGSEEKINVITPIILVINGIDDEILIEMETIAPITVKQFDRLFNELN